MEKSFESADGLAVGYRNDSDEIQIYDDTKTIEKKVTAFVRTALGHIYTTIEDRPDLRNVPAFAPHADLRVGVEIPPNASNMEINAAHNVATQALSQLLRILGAEDAKLVDIEHFRLSNDHLGRNVLNFRVVLTSEEFYPNISAQVAESIKSALGPLVAGPTFTTPYDIH